MMQFDERPHFPTYDSPGSLFSDAQNEDSDLQTEDLQSLSDDELGLAFEVLRTQKKRIRDRRRPTPRILRSDVRRFYATMFNNVMNSCDAALMRQFFRQYATPDLSQSLNCVVQGFDNCGYDDGIARYCTSHVQGIAGISLFWSVMNQFTPDRVTAVEHVRILTRLGNPSESSVQCTFHMSLTHCHSASTVVVAHEAVQTLCGSTYEERVLDFDLKNDNQAPYQIQPHKRPRLESNYHNPHFDPQKMSLTVPQSVPLSGKPVRALLTSTLTMRLRSDKRITALDFGPCNIAFL